MTQPIITIADPSTGAAARIAPGLGFNCFSFTVPNATGPRATAPQATGPHAGGALETLWAAENFTAGTERPSGSGIPLLFPFPGRIRGGKFTFQGRQWSLPGDDGRGNAIHGFVLNRPWRVAEKSASRVVGVFQASEVDDEILRHWPADFRLSVSYEVRGTTLASEIVVENCGNGDLPCGFGTHPYFRVPLGGPSADDCLVTVPAREYWPLEGLLPTGKRVAAGGAYDLAAGLMFAQTKFDDVFTGLSFAGGKCAASLADPGSGRRLIMTFDDSFRECVVYNPPHRQAICLEPYTCVPDAYALGEQGHETGLRVLRPGERWDMRIDIAVQ